MTMIWLISQQDIYQEDEEPEEDITEEVIG